MMRMRTRDNKVLKGIVILLRLKEKLKAWLKDTYLKNVTSLEDFNILRQIDEA